jgi:dipeptidyl aminopeptidase/acylaminoacyl peptidase
MRKVRSYLVAGLIGITIGTVAVSILVAENAVHIWERPKPDPGYAAAVASGTDAVCQPARTTAADGVILEGWIFTPRQPNGAAAILLHGVADTRAGVLGHAGFLLRAGYTVLAPDARGHGTSGGTIITYGVREAGDVHAWADWLFRNRPVDRLYGLGESMGAAILLESLAAEPRFRAVVAECPFARFDEVAYDRLSQRTGLPAPAFWPVVNLGFVWTHMRYGVDLRQASPAAVVRQTDKPVLLIHGMRDTNIPIRHSRELHALNSRSTELWEVPEAAHVNSMEREPKTYPERVLRWFREH